MSRSLVNARFLGLCVFRSVVAFGWLLDFYGVNFSVFYVEYLLGFCKCNCF